MAAILKSLVSIIIIFKCVHTSFAYAQCMFWTQIQNQNEEMNVSDAFLQDKVLSSSVTPHIIIYKLYYQNVHIHCTYSALFSDYHKRLLTFFKSNPFPRTSIQSFLSSTVPVVLPAASLFVSAFPSSVPSSSILWTT